MLMTRTHSRRWNLIFTPDTSPIELTAAHSWSEINGRILGGEISVQIDYEDINKRFPDKKEANFSYKDRYSISLESEIANLRVIDFKLPDCLRSRRIGTFAWSAMFNVLPIELRSKFRLSGSLSAVDATIWVTDSFGRLVYEHGKFAERDNVARRNAFWMRMLSGAENDINCDQNGNGGFRGLFVDPCIHHSYKPLFAAYEI